MKRYFLQPAASARLEEIYRYSIEQFGPAQADKYLDGAFALFEDIAEKRVPWRRIPGEFGVGRVLHSIPEPFRFLETAFRRGGRDRRNPSPPHGPGAAIARGCLGAVNIAGLLSRRPLLSACTRDQRQLGSNRTMLVLPPFGAFPCPT